MHAGSVRACSAGAPSGAGIGAGGLEGRGWAGHTAVCPRYALLGAAASQPWLAGLFLWRYYADLDDISQEAAWGFSPHAKLAERVLGNVFHAEWASDACSRCPR